MRISNKRANPFFFCTYGGVRPEVNGDSFFLEIAVVLGNS